MRVKGTFQELIERDDVQALYVVRYSELHECDIPTEIWDYSKDGTTFDTAFGSHSVAEVEADPEAYFIADV